MRKIKQKALKLSFNWKITILFIFSTIITLLAVNLTVYFVMKINIGSSLNIITQKGEQFQKISTSHISEALTQFTLTAGDNIKQLIEQLYLSYQFFSKNGNRNLYSSLQFPYNNVPPLTQTFKSKAKVPAAYFYTSNSTYYDDPFLDQILANHNTATLEVPFKRTNVFYWNESNPKDMMARTYPATDDFIIRDCMDIVRRADNVTDGIIKRQQGYIDQLSKKIKGAEILASFRIVISPTDRPGIKMLFQQEILFLGYSGVTRFIYYVPQTAVITLIKNQSCPNYCILDSTLIIDFDISPFVSPGYHKVTIQNGSTLLASSVSFNADRQISVFPSFSYQKNSKFRFIVLLDQSKTNQGYKFLSQFLQNLKFAITVTLVILSIVILMLVGSCSFFIGSSVKLYFGQITNIINQMIQHPQKSKQFVNQLHKLPGRGLLKMFQFHLAKIFQKIAFNNKQLASNKKYFTKRFPLNKCQANFQRRNLIVDRLILDKQRHKMIIRQ